MGGDQTKQSDRRTGDRDRRSGGPSGGARDRPNVSKKVEPKKKDVPGGGAPKTSGDYRPKELGRGGRAGFTESERRRQTRRAEREARRDVKAATGKEVKIAGEKVQHHHHAGVKEARRVRLNPKVAGERERMTAVHSRKDKKVYGTIGDSPDPKKYKVKDRHTHHGTASRIDKAEQAETAKRMGAKGGRPELPRGPKGRAGLVDASAVSKWRWPATADQTERAKHKWERKEPTGPKLDKRGRVIPAPKDAGPDKDKPSERRTGGRDRKGGDPSGGARHRPEVGSKKDMPPSSRGAPNASGDRAGTPRDRSVGASGGRSGERPSITSPERRVPIRTGGGEGSKDQVKWVRPTPKSSATPEVPKGETRIGRFAKGVEAAARVGGRIAAVGSAASDLARIIARKRPELLPEGMKVELMRNVKGLEIMWEKTGYTVEKSGGQVIYRNSKGEQVTPDEAKTAFSGLGPA